MYDRILYEMRDQNDMTTIVYYKLSTTESGNRRGRPIE